MIKRSVLLWSLGLIGVVPVAFLAGHAIAGGIPSEGALTYSGVVEDGEGAPLGGEHIVEVKFWSAGTGGDAALCTSNGKPVTLEHGRFAMGLPDSCTDVVRANPDLWVEVLLDAASLGRAKAGTVPFAVEAGHATSADSATTAASAANATHATSADSATSAQDAAALEGSPANAFQRPLQASCVSGIAGVAADGMVTCGGFVVFRKPWGNNGTASCDVFCAGAEWGETGTCVGAQKIDTGEYVTCDATNAPDGVLNGLYCWCSRPTL